MAAPRLSPDGFTYIAEPIRNNVPEVRDLDKEALGGHIDVRNKVDDCIDRHEIWWKFNREPDGRWRCSYMWFVHPTDETKDVPTVHFTVDDTPRKAFETCVRAWELANGGIPSFAMGELLAGARATLDISGHPNVD